MSFARVIIDQFESKNNHCQLTVQLLVFTYGLDYVYLQRGITALTVATITFKCSSSFLLIKVIVAVVSSLQEPAFLCLPPSGLTPLRSRIHPLADSPASSPYSPADLTRLSLKSRSVRHPQFSHGLLPGCGWVVTPWGFPLQAPGTPGSSRRQYSFCSSH